MLSAEQRLSTSDDLAAVFGHEPRLVAVYLFGSHVEGYATDRSDVDLGLVFREELPLAEELDLAGAVEDVVAWATVDCVNLCRAAAHFRHRVLAGGVLIYEGDRDAHSDFIERTLREHFDFQYHLELYRRDFAAALADAYGG